MQYIIHPHHRSKGYEAQKSQWTIPPQDEEACFNISLKNNWLHNESCWGLHIVNNKADLIGYSPLPAKDPLKIAKFVVDQQNNWHGYPVAPWKNPYDKPDQTILMNWLDSGYISKSSMAKIHRGKKCDL